MMGLQNAFSGTFQVGSVLRSLLGSLTIGELGREFFAATQSANQFRASLEVLGASPMMTSAAWERVRADANHFGADLATFSDGFSKFAVAAHESGMEIGESFKVYEGFQTVMSTLHLGTEQQNSVGLAIREIMDKWLRLHAAANPSAWSRPSGRSRHAPEGVGGKRQEGRQLLRRVEEEDG
jgi:hypothetical protein